MYYLLCLIYSAPMPLAVIAHTLNMSPKRLGILLRTSLRKLQYILSLTKLCREYRCRATRVAMVHDVSYLLGRFTLRLSNMIAQLMKFPPPKACDKGVVKLSNGLLWRPSSFSFRLAKSDVQDAEPVSRSQKRHPSSPSQLCFHSRL
jgi:hypothetical protein